METKMEHNINRDENKNEEKSSPWYLGKQYSRYWAIYRACMAYAHKDALSRCSEMKDRIGNTLYQMVSQNFSFKAIFSLLVFFLHNYNLVKMK